MASGGIPRRKHGTVRDKPDARDKRKAFTERQIHTAKTSNFCDRHVRAVRQVYDQGTLGSCTANALCSAYSYNLEKLEGVRWFNPSRLFLFFNSHLQYDENTDDWKRVWTEEGVSIRDSLKAINRFGMCIEAMWPYNPKKERSWPSKECYDAGVKNRKRFSCHYERLDHDIGHLTACIKHFSPFVFAFKVYKNFYDITRDHPIMPTPKGKPQDGHAVMAVSYDNRKKLITVLNSWGEDWGKDGYFYMPYDIITNEEVCYDFWKISLKLH